MAIKTAEYKEVKWIHIDGVDDEVVSFFKNNFKFHHLDIEDVASERQRPKIDIYKYYLFTIFVFPYYDQSKEKVRGREVDIFLNKDTLITVSKKQFPLLDKIFGRCLSEEKYKKAWLGKGPDFLFYRLLAVLFKDSARALDNLNHLISNIEDDVYEYETQDIFRDLAYLRRGVLALRRMIDPQRFTINTLVNIKRDFVSPDLSVYFDDVHDSVEKIWVSIENYKDTIDGLHLTNESLVSQHTNRVIQILTIFSATLLPLTLLSGIYGMNVQLPFADRPYLVGVVFGVFVLIIFTVLLILKKKRWF
ncbi:MAG: magnesium transporter CorA family protein [Patescibacteria group bacterium]